MPLSLLKRRKGLAVDKLNPDPGVKLPGRHPGHSKRIAGEQVLLALLLEYDIVLSQPLHFQIVLLAKEAESEGPFPMGLKKGGETGSMPPAGSRNSILGPLFEESIANLTPGRLVTIP